MSNHRIILFVAILSATCVSTTCFSQNVLLPSDNSGKGGIPNLGLMPTESEPAATPDTPQFQEPVPLTPTTTLPPALTPLPQAQPYTAPQTPTQTQYQTTPYQSPAPPAKPYTMSVTVDDGKLNPKDVETISSQMGIPQNLVASSCELKLSAALLTNNDASMIGFQPLTTTIKYKGSVDSASPKLFAVCNSAPKPLKNAFIQQLNGKYALFLSGASCSVTKDAVGVHSLVVQHTGTGVDKCQLI